MYQPSQIGAAAARREPGFPALAEVRRQCALAWYFAWSDTKARYKRSVIGPFWLVGGTAIGVAGLGFVWSILLRVDQANFIPSLTIGLVVWTLISGCIASSTSMFANNALLIKSIRTPSFRLSLQMVMQQFINFLHNLTVVALVLIVFPAGFGPLALLAIPGLALVLVNLLCLVQVFGLVGARYRDLDPLVGALMPLVFFMSPVLFRSQQLGALAVAMSFNPVAYWLDVIRKPLLGTVPSAQDYLVTAAMALFSCWLAWSVTRAKAQRLPYWM